MLLIKKKKQTPHGFEFLIAIEEEGGRKEYTVLLDREYWKKLTGGNAGADELIRKSFEFLLAREPKESVLPHFDLRDISKYFPEYEEHMLSLWR